MKIIKTVIVYSYIKNICPFSSEDYVRVIKSNKKVLLDLEEKPENVREEDLFGNLLRYTSYLFIK